MQAETDIQGKILSCDIEISQEISIVGNNDRNVNFLFSIKLTLREMALTGSTKKKLVEKYW